MKVGSQVWKMETWHLQFPHFPLPFIALHFPLHVTFRPNQTIQICKLFLIEKSFKMFSKIPSLRKWFPVLCLCSWAFSVQDNCLSSNYLIWNCYDWIKYIWYVSLYNSIDLLSKTNEEQLSICFTVLLFELTMRHVISIINNMHLLNSN